MNDQAQHPPAEEVREPTQRDLVHDMRRIPLRMPRTMRDLFAFLAHFNPDRGIDDLLSLVDFSGVTPIEIYNVVLNRAPEEIELAVRDQGFDPKRLLREMLVSAEFRHSLLRNFLAAFPEKGRDVFIHVPKCAGTDLIFNLVRRHLPLPKMLEVDGWISDEDFLAAVAGIARAAASYERVFVYGHMELGEYVDNAGIRSRDRLFTIIRDPLDLMVSQANYAIGRLRQDPTGRDPDTAEILQYLGIPRLPSPLTNRELKDLAIRALHDPRIVQPNRACLYLGTGMRMEYALAMKHLVTYNIEVTTTRHYRRWLKEQWGIAESRQHNQSDKILTRAEASRFHAAALIDAMAQDQLLFDVVSWAIAEQGTASVTGPEIARLAGPGLLHDFPASLQAGTKGRAWRADAAPQSRDLVVAQEPEAVSLYLQAPSVSKPNMKTARVVLEVAFGKGGTGRDHLITGWSPVEETFTWTDGHESILRFPALPRHGNFIVRLVGGPFVRRPQIPAQRLELAVNGVASGSAFIHDLAVIECGIPTEVLDGKTSLTVTLRLPDAAKPGEYDPIDDFRMIAFALHRVIILEIVETDAVRSVPA